MSDNHDLLNDNDMCSFSGHEAEDMCFNCGDHTCGDGSTDAVLWKIRKIGMLDHKMLWFEGKNWSKK